MAYEDMALKWGKRKVLQQQEEMVKSWHEQRGYLVHNAEHGKGYIKTSAVQSLKTKYWHEDNPEKPYHPDQVEVVAVDFEQGGEYQIGEMTWDYESSGYIIKYKIKLEDGKYKRFPTYARYGAKSSNIGELKVEAEDFTSIVNELVDMTLEELAE